MHSGDSACSLPPHSLSAEIIAEIKRQTEALAFGLKVRGLMNVQFAVKGDEIYLIEVNPRASRTVPFVAKAIVGIPIAKIAARVMAGEMLADLPADRPSKSAMSRSRRRRCSRSRASPGVDPVLSPEMKSTGEVIGHRRGFRHRPSPNRRSARGWTCPLSGTPVRLKSRDSDKPVILPALCAMRLASGFNVIGHRRHRALSARRGTGGRAREQGGRGTPAYRRSHQGRRCRSDLQHHRGVAVTQGQLQHPQGRTIRQNVASYTTAAAGIAAVRAIEGAHIA